jgi:hypothetical protein
MLPLMLTQEQPVQEPASSTPSDAPVWVRQYSKKTGKATSLWHLLLAVKQGPAVPYALTYDGEIFLTPRGVFPKPSADVCANCALVSYRLARDPDTTWEALVGV